MATLLERIKQGLGQATAPAAPVAGTETGQVEALLSAKQGIVGPQKTGLKGRSLTEALAQQQTQQELTGLSKQAELGQTAIEQASQEQAQRQAQQEQQIAQQRQQNQLRTKIQTENILQDLEQNRAKLSEEKRQAKMEQAGLLLRTQNKDYITNLQMEGAKARLSDAVKFNEELARSVMAENLAIFEKSLKSKEAIDVSNREFEKLLTNMGVTDVLNAYRAESKQAQKQALIGGVAETAKTGVQIYGQQKQGQYDTEYQSYLESVPLNERPMSYSQFQAREKQPGFVGPPRE